MERRKFIGFTPYEWQRDVINDVCTPIARGRTFAVKSRRQCGKSVMLENILLWYALNIQGSVSAAVSPTLAQSRKLFKDIVDAVWEGHVIKKKNETLLSIEFINGSTVFFKSSEQRDALRGFTLTGILCLDECVYIPDDILELCLPWTQVHKCPVLMVSTPKFKTGFFFRYFTLGKQGDNYVKSFDWMDYDTSALLDSEQLEHYRQMLPNNQFLSEYMGEFLDTDGLVFTGFRECMGAPEKGSKLYIGIDWGAGGGNDYTVICSINEHGQQEDLVYWNNKTTQQQIDAVCEYIELNYNRIAFIVPELNSIGTPFTDMVMSKYPSLQWEGFHTLNSTKNELVTSLQTAFEKKTIQILENEEQAVELGAYSAEYNPKTHNTYYNAPQGLHDDKVMAMCFAWYAYTNAGGYGRYTVSFLN